MEKELDRIISELRKINSRLQEENRHFREENDHLRERMDTLIQEKQELEKQLQEAQALAARQAAPFRRPERSKIPPDQQKRPGRKIGHPGSYRPSPPQIDDTAEIPLTCCPRCGRKDLRDIQRVEQIIEEIIPAHPYSTKVVTYEGICPQCGPVASRHPLQTSQAQGAAKVQLGPRALATAVELNKVHGLTMRKTCHVLESLTGLHSTPGGISQSLARIADRMEPHYQSMIQELRNAPAVFADETSWWVGGPKWWLWVFTNPETTVYRVDRSRGSQVVEDILGREFQGMLVSDCLASYNPATCSKHKCIAHHLKAIAEAKTLPGMTDPSYLNEWTLYFKGVIGLYHARPSFSESEFAEKRRRMEIWRDTLLARPCGQPGDVRIHNRLKKQQNHLLGCLYEPQAEPTNNRAERALRPAVISRKVSCGNKTERGKRTWEILASLGATCRQKAINFTEYLANAIRYPPNST